MKKCTDCDNPVVEGRSFCEYHLNNRRINAKNRRMRLSNNGLCKSCYIREPEPGKKLCSRCIQYRKDWYKKKRESGLCYACGNPVDNGKAYCSKCAGFGGKSDHTSKHGTKRGIAINRDNFVCQICGSSKNVVVHHIDGNGHGLHQENDNPNDDMDNLVTVCSSCHGWIHGMNKRLKKIKNLIEIIRYAQLLP